MRTLVVVCALVVSSSIAVAEEHYVVITKIEVNGSKWTISGSPQLRPTFKGKVAPVKLTGAEDIKVFKVTKKVVDGKDVLAEEPVENGLKNELFRGVTPSAAIWAFCITSDNGEVTKLVIGKHKYND